MKIYLETKNYRDLIVIEAENVRVEHDVQERTYPHLKQDGTVDYFKPVVDISAEAIEDICKLLDDMLSYRQKDFKSDTSVINQLISLLPEEDRDILLRDLKQDYDI